MRNNSLNKLTAMLFGFAAAFCGIGCLMTGMVFLYMPMSVVAAACALAAAVTMLTADRKWFPVIPVAFLLLCVHLWRKGTLKVSIEAFLNRISNLYNLGYGWGTIRWSDEVLLPNAPLLVLCLIGAWLAMYLCYSLLKGKGILFPLLLTCLPVIPCMLLVDTIPQSGYLFGTLTCAALLLMIRLSKKQSGGFVLLRFLAIPTALAVLLLFGCLPQKNYSGLQPVEDLFAYIQGFFAENENTPDIPQTPAREEGSWVNLNAVGPKRQRRGIVMEVKANQSGYLYLRGSAYSTYHGTWWDYALTEDPTYLAPTATQRSVEITTKAIHSTLYLPYGAYGIDGSDFTIQEKQGRVDNTGQWRSYTVKYQTLPPTTSNWQANSSKVHSAHTQLPQDTRQAARDYLNQHLPGYANMGVWNRANAIVNHVAASAQYSLNTPKMPKGTDDFALWFLEESDTGYCIHFATAAAVLLRAAGIPCRYVTGYLVYAEPNVTVEVEQHNSHAWVEVYIDNVGWVPLEPTPGGGISQTVDRETTAPTETEATTENTTEATTQATTEATTGNTTEATTEATTLPAKPTSPIGGADAPTEPAAPQTPAEPEMPWLPVVLRILLIAAVILGQWRVRVALRHRRRQKGKRSAQALRRWQEVELHCRIRKVPVNEQLFALAQKAKFSQHPITQEELLLFDNWLNLSKTILLSSSNIWQTFLATILYALF